MASNAKSVSKKNNRKRLDNISNVGAFFISLLSIFCLTGLIIVGYILINVISVTAGDPVINLETAMNNQNQTSFLYADDKDGNQIELLRLHGEENRIWVDLDQIPENLQNAFVSLEDKRFYKHHGVDWKRTIGVAVKQNGQGGSTITQQLIKNLTGDDKQTWERKLREIFRAL
ncbi:MAG: transglycosylase domain-containing protein, partial [Clostridia bacterium]|nr:transglycosylase domain-containing protein [Clostridia bacterium]